MPHPSARRVPGFLEGLALALIFAAAAVSATLRAEASTLEDLVAAVVDIKTSINRDGTTVRTLGRERRGSGIVIDQSGLILTIGYLMVEAESAEVRTNAGRALAANVVGYDPESGFGLLRTAEPPGLKPMSLGRSALARAGDPVLVASSGGPAMVLPAHIVAKRQFAGSWEYMLEEAIFTSPPHPEWSGAALVGRDGQLIGVGSLIVADAAGENEKSPGNMFVPIDLLPPILADLIADGRRSGPAQPWLGMSTEESGERLVVTRVTPGGPAEKAGVQQGDVVVGVDGTVTRSLVELYRRIRERGPAGAVIPLDLRHGSGEVHRREIRSIDRLDLLKFKSTL